MYHTIWIDILSGKDHTVPEGIMDVFNEFKESPGVKSIEMGIAFEDWDIFAIVEVDHSEVLIDFLINDVCKVPGIEDFRLGNLHHVSSPHALENKLSEIEEDTYFLVYIDATPEYYQQIYETLAEREDPDVRFFGYCLDQYDKNIVICLLAENIDHASEKIVRKFRVIEGVRDTLTYIISNVIYL